MKTPRSADFSNAIPPEGSTTSATKSPISWPPATGLRAEGARVLGDGEPETGAHGNPVLFLHPKDFSGALIELEEVR